MMNRQRDVSLYSYIGTIFSFCFLFFPSINLTVLLESRCAIYIVPLLYYLLLNVVIKFLYKNEDYQVAVRAALLGFVFAVGSLVYYTASERIYIFGVYMCILSFFHYSEFLSIAIIKPRELSTNSFLLYHSPQYVIAAVASWIEFFTESYFFPNLKTSNYISYIGLSICIFGEVLRKLAMLTARANFDHLVQSTKAKNHELVTHGIYSYFRHPSYVGWFYWSIGTQIILMNPICIVGYTLASWMFFNQRVTVEEISLLSFFGQDYCDYQQRVGTGLPLIKGYRIEP